MKIAVLVHLYYLELIPEIDDYISNLTGQEYKLFFTLPIEKKRYKYQLKKKYPKSSIIIIKNVGFDIYPFLMALKKVNLNKYDLICKIHTKRNTPSECTLQGYDLSGGYWRDYLLSAVLGSKERVREIINIFNNDKTIGMIGAQELIMRNYDFICHDGVDKIIHELGLKVKDREFIAGTAFIVRSCILQCLQRRIFKSEQFPPYSPPPDFHTLPYLMERVFGFIVSAQNYRLVGLKTTGLHCNTNRLIIEERQYPE